MKIRVLTASFILIASAFIGCSDDAIDECTALNNCVRNASGAPTCMAGFAWEDATDADNYNCVAAEIADGQNGNNTGDNNGNGNSGNNTDDNNGCPPNSTWQNDGCYCDEGFVISDDQTGCVEGDSSDANCPPNSHWVSDGTDEGCYCDDGYIVNEERTACVLECEADTDCPGGEVCIDNSCRQPPCTPGSCDQGLVCDEASGLCITDLGTLPPQPNLQCNVLPSENCGDDDLSCIPDWQCTGSNCNQITSFDPRVGDHYDDYEINGEGSSQYRSFIREDVLRLVKYSSAWVRCMSAPWTFSNGRELGLGDMSEANGAIPGASQGSPGHPEGTHVNGHDMDLGYYQLGTTDNYLRPICEHVSGGQDQYHCVSEPTSLDVWRTALVLAKMHDNPNLRVIGVDGKAGLLVTSAITQMCNEGWISGNACNNLKLAYEVTDEGRGWFRFHHHHFHISISGAKRSFAGGQKLCLTPRCAYDFREDPRHRLYQPLWSPIKED